LKYEGNAEKDMALSFEYNYSFIENGMNIPVTNENRKQFKDLIIDYVFNKSVATQFDFFTKGQ
jgi:hypothetical protein